MSGSNHPLVPRCKSSVAALVVKLFDALRFANNVGRNDLGNERGRWAMKTNSGERCVRDIERSPPASIFKGMPGGKDGFQERT